MLLRSCRSALLSISLVASTAPAAGEPDQLHPSPPLHDSTSCLEAEIRLPEISPQWPYFLKPLRTALVECSGELLYEMVTSLAGEPHGRPEWQVPIEKLWLYSAPNDSARTDHYLVRNELAEMLAFVNEDWMKIAYQGTEGRQKAWVSLRATHDLGERYEPGISDHEPLALWALDYYDSEEDPDFYRNLFTLFVDNVSHEPVEVHAGEIHLLFVGPDGERYTQRLYPLFNFSLQPAESRILDDNPVERHGERHVLFHGTKDGTTYVEFFPPEIKPGLYQVIPVLTTPFLPQPIFARHGFRLEFPPQLDPDLVKP